jgi:hypothetical protein
MFRKKLSVLLSLILGLCWSDLRATTEAREEFPRLLSSVGWESYKPGAGALLAGGGGSGVGHSSVSASAGARLHSGNRRSPRFAYAAASGGSSSHSYLEPSRSKKTGPSSLASDVVVSEGGEEPVSAGDESRAGEDEAKKTHSHSTEGLDTLKQKSKEYLYSDGVKTKECFEAGLKLFPSKSDPWTKNTLVVHVLYQNSDKEVFDQEISYVFVSGWDLEEDRQKHIKEFFNKEVVVLGDFYQHQDNKNKISLSGESSAKSKNGSGSLKGDFDERGISLNKMFSCSSYAHSEQAFISYIERSDEARLASPIIHDTHIPTGVTLLMISKNNPCPQCHKMMQHLIGTEEFKNKILKKMFPGITSERISLNIIYGYYHDMGSNASRSSQEESDLVNSIDFEQKGYYISVGMRDTRGAR